MRSNAWYGCRRDIRDARDVMFPAKKKAVRLPAKVDLRPHCPAPMNQGDIGSCTAHGITSALRYLAIKAGRPDAPLSRLALYYEERAIEGTTAEDAGAEIRTGIKVATKLGVPPEDLWPYDPKMFDVMPAHEAYTVAPMMAALAYQRVAVSTSALKQALASGFPVVIGVSLYDSFESDRVARTGVVPMPMLNREQLVGGHCMLAVGYGQRAGCFTVRNSWDADWGAGGDCYFPEAYLGSTLYGSDYWMIRSAR